MTDQIVVTPDAQTAGAISYWRLSGAVSLSDLTDAWKQAGLPESDLPAEPSDKVGLSRAIRTLSSKTRQSFQITGGDFKGGWALADVDTEDGNVGTKQVLRVVRAEGSRELRIDVEPGYEFDDGEPVEIKLRRAYIKSRSELAATDVSHWLIALARKAQALSLRDSGGVYFIPRDEVDRWEKIVGVLSGVSNGEYRVFRIPAMQTQEAVEAILDGIEVEAKATIEAFETDLEKEGEDALGARALKTRKAQAEALEQKLAKYEGLLNVKLDSLRESLETTQADLQAAEWALEAEKDKAEDEKKGHVAA